MGWEWRRANGEKARVTVKLLSELFLAMLVIGTAGGYLAAGGKDAAAGAFAGAVAYLASLLGVVPVVGVLGYLWVMNRVKGFIDASGVELGLPFTIVWVIGLLEAVVLTLFTTFIALVALLVLILKARAWVMSLWRRRRRMHEGYVKTWG